LKDIGHEFEYILDSLDIVVVLVFSQTYKVNTFIFV